MPTAVLSEPLVLRQHPCCAYGHIISSIVESERSRAYAGVEEGVAVAKERKPAKSRIEPAGSQAGKGTRPFIGVATPKISLRRSRSGQKPKASKHGQDDYEYCAAIFH